MSVGNRPGLVEARQGQPWVRDRGDTMLMTTILVVFLMVAAFALVSAGEAWAARRDVQATAQAAARAAVQVSADEVRGGVSIDPGLASARAAEVAGASGYSVSVSVAGTTVTATVTGSVDYAFGGAGFPGSMSATATANVERGVFSGG
jgi:Flp pilus assembly protein TadG